MNLEGGDHIPINWRLKERVYGSFYSDKELIDNFKVNRDLLNYLVFRLGPHLYPKSLRNNPVFPETSILLTLNTLATNSSQKLEGTIYNTFF